MQMDLYLFSPRYLLARHSNTCKRFSLNYALLPQKKKINRFLNRKPYFYRVNLHS